MKRTGYWSAALAVVRKDVLTELRSRELVASMGLFALLAVLIFSFALELNRNARLESVAGVLWVTIVFASILGLNRSMSLERDQGNIDGLLLTPVPRGALYAGKLAGNFVFTLTVGLVVVVALAVLFNVPLAAAWLLPVLALGTLGFTSIGTLLSAMTVQTRSRESLLPILMLPVAVPLLLASVRATSYLLAGANESLWLPWVTILIVLVVIYLVLGALLYGVVLEE